jgi:hypothetical protein
MKVGLKWKCKVGTGISAYCAKWLLTKHLKEMHGLVVKKVKLGRPSTSEKGFQHQNHAKMNIRILGDAWLCKGRMIKRLLIAIMPKPNTNGIS